MDVMITFVPLQALEVMETLIIPGSDKIDVRNKEEVSSNVKIFEL